MDPEIIILSDISQRQISYDVTYTWNIKKIQLTNKTNILTDIEDKLYGLRVLKALGRRS